MSLASCGQLQPYVYSLLDTISYKYPYLEINLYTLCYYWDECAQCCKPVSDDERLERVLAVFHFLHDAQSEYYTLPPMQYSRTADRSEIVAILSANHWNAQRALNDNLASAQHELLLQHELQSVTAKTLK